MIHNKQDTLPIWFQHSWCRLM